MSSLPFDYVIFSNRIRQRTVGKERSLAFCLTTGAPYLWQSGAPKKEHYIFFLESIVSSLQKRY